ncbi:hypothetical protein ACIRU8_45385 [Streptomyces sp. NPDC101175]|uniref:competence protein CoiA family protein n=1 Tax=Streptomyces sp. NPDC101175 TaxID=3366123 RepID=UPI0038342D91
MANGVWHSGLQKILKLDQEDLGLGARWPGLAELKDCLLQPVAERDRELLVCVARSQGRQCKAELSGVKSPHMYVRKHRGPDGLQRLRAVHLPTPHEMTTEESDQHKAMKDFLARTGQAAGLEVHVEKTTKNRTSRPDVTIVGAGGVNLGCEAQYYNASAGTVLRRSKAHAEAGLTANWITHDDRFHLIDRSNWMLTRQMTWREINNAADLALIGGFRVLVEWRCTASAERPCPNARVKTGCGKVHLQWDTPRRQDDEGTGWTGHEGNTRAVTVGQTLIGAATGSVTPLFASSRKDRRSGAYMWVRTQDRFRWADYRTEEDQGPEQEQPADEGVHFSGREVDIPCTFGDDTFASGARLERRGLYAVELTLTADDPAPPRNSSSARAMEAPHQQIPVPIQAPSAAEKVVPSSENESVSVPSPDENQPNASGLPASLIALQRAANLERTKLEQLTFFDERTHQRQIWFEASVAVQNAVTHYATTANLNRFDVEQELRSAAKAPDDATEPAA